MTHLLISHTARKLGIKKPEGPSSQFHADSATVIHHKTSDGLLLWDRKGRGTLVAEGAVPEFEAIDNVRAVFPGVSGIYRGGQISQATDLDRAKLAALLHVPDSGVGEIKRGRIIDLRTENATVKRPDLRVPGANNYQVHLPAYTPYVQYLTEWRSEVKYALMLISQASGPVYLHCTHGRDRTGIVVMMLQAILGYSDAVIREEYLKSPGAAGDQLNSLFDHVNRLGGDIRRYATGAVSNRSLGMFPDTVQDLRMKYPRLASAAV